MKGAILKRSRVIQLGCLVLLALVVSGVTAAFAFGGPAAAGPPVTANATLVIDGSTLNVSAFSTGESNSGSLGGSGSGAGKVNFQDLSVSTLVDASTPALNQAVASGEHFDTAVLTYSWGTGKNPETFTYELDDVLLSSISEGASGGAPSENLSLAFGKVKWTDTAPNGTTTTGSWDIETNTTG